MSLMSTSMISSRELLQGNSQAHFLTSGRRKPPVMTQSCSCKLLWLCSISNGTTRVVAEVYIRMRQISAVACSRETMELKRDPSGEQPLQPVEMCQDAVAEATRRRKANKKIIEQMHARIHQSCIAQLRQPRDRHSYPSRGPLSRTSRPPPELLAVVDPVVGAHSIGREGDSQP